MRAGLADLRSRSRDGGLRVTTTLDTKLQKTAEKWVKAATIVPNAKNPAATAKRLGLKYEPWMKNLVDKNLQQRRPRRAGLPDR